jgi:hypothetical protein
MAIVYRHIRLDKNLPFYIGIGISEKRAYSKMGRNAHWHNIVSKTPYQVEIIFDDLTHQQAQEKEKEFIALYGRSENGGLLCNRTDGGEWTEGMKWSDEVRKNMSEASKKSEKKIKHILTLNAQKKGKKLSPELVEKYRQVKIGKKRSESFKKKISEINSARDKEIYERVASKHRGMKRSEEAKKKMSDSFKRTYLMGMILSHHPYSKIEVKECGTKNGVGKMGTNTGKKFSEETKMKMRIAAKNDWLKRKKQLDG